MLNEHAQAWVKALRSGEFAQSTGILRKTDGYCCLGVACELYHQDTGNGDWAGSYTPNEYTFVEGDAAVVAGLPTKVHAWLGLKVDIDNLGHLPSGDGLAAMNDYGKTFAEIADVIEFHADELFETA